MAVIYAIRIELFGAEATLNRSKITARSAKFIAISARNFRPESSVIGREISRRPRGIAPEKLIRLRVRGNGEIRFAMVAAGDRFKSSIPLAAG